MAPKRGLIFAGSPRKISDVANEIEETEKHGRTSAATSCKTDSQYQSKHPPAPRRGCSPRDGLRNPDSLTTSHTASVSPTILPHALWTLGQNTNSEEPALLSDHHRIDWSANCAKENGARETYTLIRSQDISLRDIRSRANIQKVDKKPPRV